jgi:hypothetical protein
MVYALEYAPVPLEVPEAICVDATPGPEIDTVYALEGGILPETVIVTPAGPLAGLTAA